jgi:hypothetical protein
VEFRDSETFRIGPILDVRIRFEIPAIGSPYVIEGPTQMVDRAVLFIGGEKAGEFSQADCQRRVDWDGNALPGCQGDWA